MQITVQRRPSNGLCTIGDLSISTDPATGLDFRCFTLEDVVRERAGVPVAQWKIQNQTAIPAGTYKVITDLSARFRKIMLRLLKLDGTELDGFAGIRIHSGNVASDTDGCILVGNSVTHDGRSILQSAQSLGMLQPFIQAALDRGEEVTIDVRNAPQSTTT